MKTWSTAVIVALLSSLTVGSQAVEASPTRTASGSRGNGSAYEVWRMNRDRNNHIFELRVWRNVRRQANPPTCTYTFVSRSDALAFWDRIADQAGCPNQATVVAQQPSNQSTQTQQPRPASPPRRTITTSITTIPSPNTAPQPTQPTPTATAPTRPAPQPTPTATAPTITAPQPTPTATAPTRPAPQPTPTATAPTRPAPQPTPTATAPTITAPQPEPTAMTVTQPAPAHTAPPASQPPTATTSQPRPTGDIAGQILALVNAERQRAGVAPLTLNSQLNAAAQRHGQDMANNNHFSHTGTDGSSVGERAVDAGYAFSYVGENIAWGQTSAAEVMRGWMNSDGHRRNILNPNYTELGVAHVVSASGRPYWVQKFGRPR